MIDASFWMLVGALFPLLQEAKAPTDPQWTEEEVKARIELVFTPEQRKHVEVFRSKYYIIFTDSAAGKSFGKIMDQEVYEGFRKLFPFEDTEEQRLMAVYLFKTKDGYDDFCVRVVGWTKAKASQSGGHAWKDYYATSYSSPRDSVHWHEGAHQIMSNRLRLGGGGSWFQEGVAEYYQDKIDKLNRGSETRAAIKAKEVLSFRQLMTSESLLFSGSSGSKKGYGGSSGRYGQAASVILFLKEGPLKEKFAAFFKRIGRTPRGKIEEISKVIQEVYGLSVDELEDKWKEYFLK